MTRSICLALFNNGPKPAHYDIWIPKPNTNTLGKLIQVDGNPATGFLLQLVPNYNIASADPAGTERLIDTTARGRLESVATVVKPPGRSANPSDPEAPNCQI